MSLLPIVEILRREENEQFGTFGILSIQKRVFCVTLEPPDRLNVQQKSSIPAQQYICKQHESPRFGDTYLITSVPGRSLVLFHPGNVVEDTLGCIILGQHFGKLKAATAEKRAVLNSGKTFKDFMRLMGNTATFHLSIVEHYA